MSSPQNSTSDLSPPPTFQFPPTPWGDHFLSHVSNIDDLSVQQQFEGLKEEIRSMLLTDSSENIYLIDAVQHLAVHYHFRDEITIALKKLFSNFNTYEDDDLTLTALRFRLLRQNGFHVSCNVFERFRDEKGNFKEELIDNVEGMLSLYEAAHLGIHGEPILDEAIVFTTEHLQSLLSTANMKHHLREKVKHALHRPIRKCLQRLEARHHIDVYSNEESHNAKLLMFAKLDFNILQKQHQQEIKELTKWYKRLALATRFPYARDRIVELFFWMVGTYFEPHYSHARNILTRVIALVSLVDDTYDSGYAPYQQLQLFTKAIQRWEIGEIGILPDYMQILFSTLINTFNDLEQELAKEGRSYCVNYAREAMKKVVQAYHDEAKWLSEDYVPNMEEYMKVSLTSCGYSLCETACLLGMGNIATKEVFEWISTTPKIVTASSKICRLMDDIVSPKHEKQRHHVATGIECYMKQYGAKEEEVVQLFQKEITNAWKDINEELLKPSSIPMEILERVLNFSSAMDVMYKEDDCYTDCRLLKHHISALFNDPVEFTF